MPPQFVMSDAALAEIEAHENRKREQAKEEELKEAIERLIEKLTIQELIIHFAIYKL